MNDAWVNEREFHKLADIAIGDGFALAITLTVSTSAVANSSNQANPRAL